MVVNNTQLTDNKYATVGDTFEDFFKMYYKPLYGYAMSILKNDMYAEEIVQNIFLKLWSKRDEYKIHSSAIAYLYKAVHNESINFLNHKKVRYKYETYAQQNMSTYNQATQAHVEANELETKIIATLAALPQQCRTIFQLSRAEELTYGQIAAKLNISIKTVESQMGKALRILRIKLIDYLPLIICLLTM